MQQSFPRLVLLALSTTNIWAAPVLQGHAEVAQPVAANGSVVPIARTSPSSGRDEFGQPIVVIDRATLSARAPQRGERPGRDEFGQPIVIDDSATLSARARQSGERPGRDEFGQPIVIIDRATLSARAPQRSERPGRDEFGQPIVIIDRATLSARAPQRGERPGRDEFGQPIVIDDSATLSARARQSGERPGRDEFGQPIVIDDRATLSARAPQSGEKPFDLINNADGSITARFPNDRIPAGGEMISINGRVITLPASTQPSLQVRDESSHDDPIKVIFNGDSIFDIDLPEEFISIGDGTESASEPESQIGSNSGTGVVAKRDPQTLTFDRPLVDATVTAPLIEITTSSPPTISFNPDAVDITLNPPTFSRVKREPQTDPVNSGIIGGGTGTTIVFNDEAIDLEFNAPIFDIN